MCQCQVSHTYTQFAYEDWVVLNGYFNFDWIAVCKRAWLGQYRAAKSLCSLTTVNCLPCRTRPSVMPNLSDPLRAVSNVTKTSELIPCKLHSSKPHPSDPV